MPSDLRARHMAQYPSGIVDERRAQPPGEGAASAPSLLASKIAVPDLPTVVVHRPRLFELLSAGVGRPLTLLSAPAGFGKTVLLTSWVAAGRPPGGHVAWVSLDADDNDAGRFWSYVLAAVHRCGAAPSEAILETIPPPAPGARHLQLAPLVNGLAELETPVILVLDDFHEISDQAVLRGVQFLLRHAPPQLRLLIASRSDPQLPLPRLRTGGLLAELRAAELAFTPAEAAELLAAEGLALSDDELTRLHAHAEGWAAGLRLAALTLQRHPEPGRLIAQFAGDDRGVADYFIGEVLDRQAPEVRAVLLRSAILSRMTGPLVDALTGRGDGERVLAELERTNAFVVSLDQRSWYRYHQLFAELLRVELRHQAPEEVPELHRRAAGWYAANGFALEAVRHAMAARDWQLATTVLLEQWNDLIHDDPTVLRELLALLPPELAQEDPELALASAADRAEVALPSVDPLADGSRGSVPLLLAAFQLGEAWQANDVDGISVAALKMLALLGDAGAEPREDDEARVFALCALVAAEQCSGDLEAAGASLERGLGIARRAGLERSRLDCLSQLAVLEGVRGRLRAAFRAAHATLELAEQHGWSNTPQAARAHLALTMVHGHRNELGAAKDHLDRVILISSNGQSPVLMDGVSVVHAWLSLVRGDIAGAQALLARTRQRLAGCRPPAFMERSVTVMEAGLHAATGDLQAAKAMLRRADESLPRTAEVAVTLASLELADGEPAAAAATLAPCLNGSASTLSFALLTYACLLGALAAHALDDDDHAFRLLERALVLADQEGFRLQFTTVGSGVRPLLAAQLDHDTAHRTLILELLEALEPAPTPAPADPGPEQVVLIEPLSERERIVLRFLGGVLSNVEIASELYVSVNTVKTHVKSIYRKLDVTGRREAIRKARELHLL
jgi:LuxR family transcriptional regulator, maltose regulon positive regulatory protein